VPDVNINLVLKRDKARAAAEAFRRDMDSLNKGMAADAAAARKAETDAVKAANREKVEAAKAAAKAEAEAAKEKAATAKEAAKVETEAAKAAAREKAAAAKEAAKADAAANKEKAGAAREAARPERELRAAALTEEQAAHRAKVELARGASKDKVAALTETARRERELRGVSLSADQVNHRAKVELSRKASQDQVDAMVEANTRGKLSFGEVTATIGTTVAAVAPLISALKLVQAAYDEVGERQRKFGEKSLGKLEGQAQVAALSGQRQGKRFAVDQAKVGMRTFQNTEELNRGQIAFMNEGVQFIGPEPGKKIGAGQAQAAYEATARVAVTRGTDTAAVAGLTAQTLGTDDFNKFGDKGGQEAATRTAKMLSILSAGSGDESQLARELSKTRASLVSKGDPLHGVMSDEDAAIMTSLMAEIAPGEEAAAVRASVKAMRDFGDEKTGPFLKAAKVDANDKPFEAVAKIKTALEAQAKARGGGATAEDIAREVFPDIRGATGIAGMTGKLGQVDQRRSVAAAVTTESMAQGEQEFRRTARGGMREDAARRALDDERKGQEQAVVNIQREQARTKLQESGQYEGVGTAITDSIGKWMLLGAGPDFKRGRELRQQMDDLLGKMPADLKEKYAAETKFIPENDPAANDLFTRMNRDLTGRGVSPVTGEKADPGSEEYGQMMEEAFGLDFGPARNGMDLRRRAMGRANAPTPTPAAGVGVVPQAGAAIPSALAGATAVGGGVAGLLSQLLRVNEQQLDTMKDMENPGGAPRPLRAPGPTLRR